MKETREETYRKVFIKSEADYPKTEGEYFCCRNGFNSVQRLIPDNGKKSYMREIDWYLQPQEKEKHDPSCQALLDVVKGIKGRQTAEEIKQTMFNDIEEFVRVYMMKVGGVEKKDVIEHDLREGISIGLVIASKYASQSQSSVLPSDSIIKGGWECPRCGRMNAVWKSVCDCPPRTITSSTINGTYINQGLLIYVSAIYC